MSMHVPLEIFEDLRDFLRSRSSDIKLGMENFGELKRAYTWFKKGEVPQTPPTKRDIECDDCIYHPTSVDSIIERSDSR